MFDASKERDLDVLREMVKELQVKVLFLEKDLLMSRHQSVSDEELCKKLSEELLLLKKRIYDSKSEKRKKWREWKQKIKEKMKRKRKLPHNTPDNAPCDTGEDLYLEEETVDHKLENEKTCPECGSEDLSPMQSAEESGEIDVLERRYIFKRHQRQKYSCKGCQKIITAPGGVKLTPGGEYSIGLASQIACDKYDDHIPLERQRKRMERFGINVDVKTLYGLTEHLYNRLECLNEMIRKDVLRGGWVHIDESPVTFFNPAKSRGYVWSMSNQRGAYYQFEATRSGEVAKEMLKGYEQGNVVTDGYSGYNFLDRMAGINHCFCWSHVRRKFLEAMQFDSQAEEVVDLIANLYEVEHEASNLDKLSQLRSEKSLLVVRKIDSWVSSMEGHFLNSTSMGKAINYYLKRKKGLHHFLSDKNAPMDNNMAERRQRCPVMGRKNYLFFRSVNGADVGTFFYSVIESCKTNGLLPDTYIREMAIKSVKGESIESPYDYSKRLNGEIGLKLKRELEGLKPRARSP